MHARAHLQRIEHELQERDNLGRRQAVGSKGLCPELQFPGRLAVQPPIEGGIQLLCKLLRLHADPAEGLESLLD
jgi:hypothetical protein